MGIRTVCCRCRRVLVSSNGRRLDGTIFDASLVTRKAELLAATGDSIDDGDVTWAWCQGCWDAERASVNVNNVDKEQVSKWLFTLAHGKQSEKVKAKIAGEILHAFSELEKARDNWKQAADWLRQALELRAEASELRRRRAEKKGEGGERSEG